MWKIIKGGKSRLCYIQTTSPIKAQAQQGKQLPAGYPTRVGRALSVMGGCGDTRQYDSAHMSASLHCMSWKRNAPLLNRVRIDVNSTSFFMSMT